MSYYYDYFLGKRDKETRKVSLAGPFDRGGEALPVLTRSRSFGTYLRDEMSVLPPDEWGDDLEERFTYVAELAGGTASAQAPRRRETVRAMDFDRLHADMPFSSGYVPAEDVMERRAGEDEEGFGFSDRLTAEQYAVFCQSYLANSSLRRSVDRFDPQRDDFKTVELAPADYIRYMWVTERSKSYEEWFISKVAAELGIDLTVGKEFELVVLEVEG